MQLIGKAILCSSRARTVMPGGHLKPFGAKAVPNSRTFFCPKRSLIMTRVMTGAGQETARRVLEQISRKAIRIRETNAQAHIPSRTEFTPASLNVTHLKSPGNACGDAAHANTSPSPHSPAQPHVVQRYGRAEYVGAVGAG